MCIRCLDYNTISCLYEQLNHSLPPDQLLLHSSLVQGRKSLLWERVPLTLSLPQIAFQLHH